MSIVIGIDSILALIGAATGIAAIVISYLTFESQKPKIKVKVTKCEHEFEESKTLREIRFFTHLEILNRGDRGTTISKIELAFVNNGKKYALEQEMRGEQIVSEGLFGRKDFEYKRLWINSLETKDISPIFAEVYEGSQKENIECTLTVYHTLKTCKIKVVSKKVEHQPLE